MTNFKEKLKKIISSSALFARFWYWILYLLSAILVSAIGSIIILKIIFGSDYLGYFGFWIWLTLGLSVAILIIKMVSRLNLSRIEKILSTIFATSIIIIIFFVGYVFSSYYSTNVMSNEEKFFYQKLKEFKQSGNESIKLKELTNFRWDRVFYIGPYSGLGKVNSDEIAKFKLDKPVPDGLGKNGVEDESFFTLILLNDADMTGKVLVLQRNEINFEKRLSGYFIANKTVLKSCTKKDVYDFSQKTGQKKTKIVDYKYFLLTESGSCLLSNKEALKLISEYK